MATNDTFVGLPGNAGGPSVDGGTVTTTQGSVVRQRTVESDPVLPNNLAGVDFDGARTVRDGDAAIYLRLILRELKMLNTMLRSEIPPAAGLKPSDFDPDIAAELKH